MLNFSVNGTPSNEVLVVQSPSSSADNENMFASSCGSDRIGSQTVSSPNDYVVNGNVLLFIFSHCH